MKLLLTEQGENMMGKILNLDMMLLCCNEVTICFCCKKMLHYGLLVCNTYV